MKRQNSCHSGSVVVALAISAILTAQGSARGSSDLPRAIIVEVESHYGFNEGSVSSMDDLGVGNRKAAILQELTKLQDLYADRPNAANAIHNAIDGIRDAGDEVLALSEWNSLADAPFVLTRGQFPSYASEPPTGSAPAIYLGQTGADWMASSMMTSGQVTALWGEEGFKVRTSQPESPEQWEVMFAALQGQEDAISSISANTEIEVAVGSKWAPTPEPTIPIYIIEKSTKAAPKNRGIKRSRDKTIYGEDDRREVFEINWPEAYTWAQGVASIGNRSEAQIHEKGYCTAFLIGTDKAITNSHCINGEDYYSKALRFGDQYAAEGIPDTIQAFTVAKILVWDVPYDIAVLQLNPNDNGDHAGSLYPVLPISGLPRDEGSPLYMIGHPEGLMKKFAPNCKVIRRPYRDDEVGKHILGVDCDAFGGNSGSPIFDAATHEVIAFLWGGQLDTQEFEEATEYIHEYAVPFELIAAGATFRYGSWPQDVAISLEASR